jgi:hypothetical protein
VRSKGELIDEHIIIYNTIQDQSTDAEGDVSNSNDFLKCSMAVGTSSKAKALTANLDAL